MKECIDSILSQIYTKFELILVNDGSPDGSGDICDDNAGKDTRIRVIHQENQGVTRARANGVKIARGEFICFVDADDTIPPHSLSTLVEVVRDDIDIVLGKMENSPCPPRGEISRESFREMSAIWEAYHVGPCAKLYRRSLFTDDVFDISPLLKLGEDAIMNTRLAYRMTGKAYSTNAVVYHYRDNPESVTHVRRRNPEQDVMLQTYRLSAIPPADVERFLPLGLARNLINFWMTATCYVAKLPESVLEYHRYLLTIRKYADIRLGVYAGLLFYCTNSFWRALAIGARNICHSIMRKVK